MNRKILLMPIMAISLLISCNKTGGDDTEVSLTAQVKYCTVKGLKDQYNKGDKVSLTFTPYPYFSLPNKKDILVDGVKEFNYSDTSGELSFNITAKTSIVVECYSSFGGKVVSLTEANNFFDIRDKNHLTIKSLHYDYEFSNIGEETEEAIYILGIINSIIKNDVLFTTLKENKTIEGDEANKYSITYSNKLFSNENEDTTYIMKAADPTIANNDDEMLISSSNIQPIEEIKQGVTGLVHYFYKSGDIDELNFTFKNVVIKDRLGPLEPINGYIKINAKYNQ